jgi:hypothetical protein
MKTIKIKDLAALHKKWAILPIAGMLVSTAIHAAVTRKLIHSFCGYGLSVMGECVDAGR